MLDISYKGIMNHFFKLFFFVTSLLISDHNGAIHIKATFKPRDIFVSAIIGVSSIVINNEFIQPVYALISTTATESKEITKQSSGWNSARQKRTASLKAWEDKGILQIDTDESGNQFLKLPWVPDKRIAYKSLSTFQRLQNEVFAGIIGEVSKDVLLHSVDTIKTRKQITKKKSNIITNDVDGNIPTNINVNLSITAVINNIKDLYSGFPVVLASSIPQGGLFFLIKKSVIEICTVISPVPLPEAVKVSLATGLATVGYWVIRTPAEVIKTQIQTGQSPNYQEAIENAKSNKINGIFSLWKYYKIMLSLDIPFQIFNFVLLGTLSDFVLKNGVQTSIFSRLFCGITCGMITAGITCPLDVCKTRIISRDRAASQNRQKENNEYYEIKVNEEKENVNRNKRNNNKKNENYENTNTVTALLSKKSNDMILQSDTKNESKNVLMNRDINILPTLPEYATSGSTTTTSVTSTSATTTNDDINSFKGNDMINELFKIIKEEGKGSLFLGVRQRLLYVGLANGIRLAAYGTSRMDLMIRNLDDL